MAVEQRSRAGLQTERNASGFVILEQIPQALLSHPQWVCWRYVNRGEGKKPDKQPVNPRNLANAGVVHRDSPLELFSPLDALRSSQNAQHDAAVTPSERQMV